MMPARCRRPIVGHSVGSRFASHETESARVLLIVFADGAGDLTNFDESHKIVRHISNALKFCRSLWYIR